ncbi:MAG: hypothetical protein ABWY63_14205 [Hyphomicrobiaceae bacterium]
MNPAHLFHFVCWAHENLPRVETDLVVVYEDGEGPAKVLVPAPEWLASALHGPVKINGVLLGLPPVEHYHNESRDESGTFTGPRNYWTTEVYEPMGPMSEEEAIEYLIMKDIPRRVWDTGSNYAFTVCRRSQLPPTRRWRNAWAIRRSA